MSLAGFRKQINKANQYVSEKIGGAEATKLADDFHEMERKTDITNELVEDIILKTKEYLQPNPASRAKMMASSKLSKISGGQRNQPYPQPEGTLGEAMVKYGKQMGEDCLFAQSLVESGEALRQMADVKYSLEDNMKQNFLDPLQQLQNRELKDVMHHRKKLQGRRLDYDCKKRKQQKGAHITEDEIHLAEEKFEESLQLAQMGMHHLLENDVEQISQLAAFAEGLYEYHKQCADVLQTLTERILDLKMEATNRPRSQFVAKKLTELVIPVIHDEHGEDGDYNGTMGAPPPYSSTFPGKESRSPARSPISSPVNPTPPHDLFPPGGPPPASRSPNGNRMLTPMNFGASPLPSPVRSPRTPVRQPCCQALYDFEAENDGELGFREGDTINLTQRIDENWYEGTVHGKKGYFPVNYVQIVVPLP